VRRDRAPARARPNHDDIVDFRCHMA
jgi:hypothetical protein